MVALWSDGRGLWGDHHSASVPCSDQGRLWGRGLVAPGSRISQQLEAGA